MAVNVYFPLGIPVNVKVTQDTPILQILTEACSKKNVNPDEYDLKYHNQILDVNTTIRYARVANNAKVDLVKRKIPRTASNVKICVQLENRDRKSGEFPSSVNIQHILKELNVEYNAETAVIIFTQREIHGKDFETTTLISLGLASGSALFRLMNRDPERPREQAHVYVPPTPKVSKLEEEEDHKPKPVPIAKDKVFDPISAIKAERGIAQKPSEQQVKNEAPSQDENQSKAVEEACGKNVCEPEKKVKEEAMEVEESKEAVVEEPFKEPEIYYLDEERQALLFHQADAQTVPQTEIEDAFFDVTVRDLTLLQTDMQKLNNQLQNTPLTTEKLRNLEKEKAVLTMMHKYKKAVIRIFFPNQLVLQGIFRPLEPVEQLKAFVRTYLENPETDFSLYTTPPRYDLNAEKNLLDEGLVPSAKVYFAGSSDLKPEIKSKLTDPSAANYAATKTRLTTTRSDAALLMDDSAGPSQVQQQLPPSQQVQQPLPDYRPQQQPQKIVSGKVPKWFKPSKK